MGKTPKKYWSLCIYVALAVGSFAAFEPVRNNGFVNYDDGSYVTENPYVKAGLTSDSIRWAFTTTRASNWHPLTWLSHMLDCQLFGTNPGWHHLTNLLFHIANTLLLFAVLKRMTGALWCSAFVAGAFALHPLHVESVAWIAERKDVLSGFFWMLTMWIYVRYTERPGISRYLLILLSFALGLMAKPMLVTLPFVLLLLDYWPLGRLQWISKKAEKSLTPAESTSLKRHFSPPFHLVVEKIPLFVLSAASSVITCIAQQRGGAMALVERLPLKFRIINAATSYLSYIFKMFYPTRLAVLYPYSEKFHMSAVVLLLIGVLVLLNRWARGRGWLTVGLLWYLGTLVPVIGLVQVGIQAMADRYTYLPSIGIFIIVAWGAAELGARWHFRRVWLGISTGLVLAILLICTRMQVRYWQNSFILCEHVLAVTKDNSTIHNNYGCALFENDQLDEAVMHFREALRINPQYSMARKNLGKALLKQGNFSEAVRCFNTVLLIKTGWPDVYDSLGLAYSKLGKDNLAITNLTKSIELDSNSAHNFNNLAWVLATTKDTKLQNPTDALTYAQRAYELAEPNQPAFLDTLAVAYAAAGNFPEAVKTAEKAIKLAEAAGEKDLAKEIQERLGLYKSGQPYREE